MTLTRRSASELLSDLATGALSAAELMQATLARIDAVNGQTNAIVGLRDRDDLMAEARKCDEASERGPLHGLPIAVKDLSNVAGIVSSQGSPHFAGFVPDSDDLSVARVRKAGAILIGKTNTPEFGLGSNTFNPVYGRTGNAYDATKTCGGSSGGAAVALATGMTALADGSDMMGSLRNPAAWNNVYGFRPSWGRVPSGLVGDMFLHKMSTLGPMARSPQDLAILLDVLSGPDRRVPYGAEHPPVAPVDPIDPKGMRIGWLADWGGAFATQDGIMSQSETALRVLEDLGCLIEPVAPPFSADAMWSSWEALRAWQLSNSLVGLRAEGAELKETAIWEIETGQALSGAQVHAASVIRSDWFRTAAALFERYDALVLPAAQVWPFDINEEYPTQIAGRDMDTYHRWMQIMVPVSLIGLPCLGAPAGFGAQGMPMGVQIFGPRGSDETLLRIGAAYHAATQWPQTRPAM